MEQVPVKLPFEVKNFIVTQSKDKKLLTITFNRPKKFNAFNTDSYMCFIDIMRWANQERDVVAILLTGSGKFYSSGNDITNFSSLMKVSAEERSVYLTQSQNVCCDFVNVFIDSPKILIAAVNGPAIGIAFTTLSLVDFVLCSETAYFESPFMPLGLSPEGCSSLTFPRIMGHQLACEVLLLGKRLSAEEAKQANVVGRVYPAGQFQEKVANYVKKLLAFPPNALLKSKFLMKQWTKDELLKANHKECEVLRERWASKEAMQATIRFMTRGKG